MPNDITPTTTANNSVADDVKFLETEEGNNGLESVANSDRGSRDSSTNLTGGDFEGEGGNLEDPLSTAENESSASADGEPNPELTGTANLFKELKEVDPEIFKKIPGLRAAIANEQQYASIFPNVRDAQEAQETVVAFNQLRESVLSGDPKPFLDELVEADPDAAQKFVDNFLPTLNREAPAVYFKVALPIVNQTLRNVRDFAKQNGLEQLYFAVGHISKHLHGDVHGINQQEQSRPDPRIQNEKQKLDQERQEFVSSQQSSFKESVNSDIRTKLGNSIARQLDPENALPKGLRKSMIAEAMDLIDSTLAPDRRHMTYMNSLWREAHSGKYTRAASDKIVSAFLARVKTLIPSTVQKVRNDYLVSDKRNREVVNSVKNNKVKQFIPSTAPSRNAGQSKNVDPKKIDFKHTSDEDIFEDKITLKK